MYTADLIITTRDGTLTCKDAGALATNHERSMASVCTIVAGTGEFLVSAGRLRIAGISPAFDGGTGDTSGYAEYEGEISSP